MSLRSVLVLLAILAVAYALPVSDVPQEVTEVAVPVEENSGTPIAGAKPRTLFMILPLLFPNQFYFS
ncbi:uncharacterized protein Dana_GF26631 [Drosophila ananassae]|uniref:Uncharacterized protein n=1 Tax=Drosophila ananassae TaxID=7217 RepID=A0A0P8ZZ21_DROAN|nr:uncharacterized protein LOC26514040 [Drosophila ananassae]KPU79871.1 uncharacterized protein Dana_GF26631 [Drosophila ananassae]